MLPVLQEVALASLNMLGNLMFMIFLSLFIVIDKDRLLAFVNQVTPPRYAEEMRLFQTSVASSFGGFLRGQAIQGLVYGAIAAAGSIALGIDFVPLTTALVAVFQMIPFFGPFVSWAPPVVAAVLTQPDALIPIVVIMAVGWFVTMNIVQPRVMASSVGIHPVVVLVSVLIGLRLYGVVGAIFADPRGGGHLGLLLPLPEPLEGWPTGRHEPRRPTPGGTRGTTRARARATARHGTGRPDHGDGIRRSHARSRSRIQRSPSGADRRLHLAHGRRFGRARSGAGPRCAMMGRGAQAPSADGTPRRR